MKLKAVLNKPYTDKERIEFIATNNHKLGYTIKMTENGMEAYDYTEQEISEFKKEQQRKLIEEEFKEKKNDILMNYLDALIHHDNEKITNIELEMESLDNWYKHQKGE